VVSAVTLELSLEDSEKLDLARSIGTLSLVLRNQIDNKTVSTRGITKSQLFGSQEAPAPVNSVKPAVVTKVVRSKPAEPPTNCVEVIQMQNGTKALNCFQ
jgi:pilus assembly protein CpaB